MSLDLFVLQYSKSVASRTDHYDKIFVSENVAHIMTLCDHFMMFESLALTPFRLQKASVRKMVF